MSNLAEAQIYAKKRGGKVHIQTGPTTFLFSCNRNHLWERPLEVIKKKYDWCPHTPEIYYSLYIWGNFGCDHQPNFNMFNIPDLHIRFLSLIGGPRIKCLIKNFIYTLLQLRENVCCTVTSQSNARFKIETENKDIY